MSDLIEIGKIVGVHGVKGCVKINATLQDATLFKSLRPISDENGHVFELTQVVVSNGQVRAMIEGVSCREEGKKLIGTVLFVPKSALPKIPADEFYYHDLVGLAVFENQTEKTKSENLGKTIDKLEEKFGKHIVKIGFTNKEIPNKQGFMTSPTLIY